MGIVDSKAVRLLSVLVSNPEEFLDRSRTIVDSRLSLFDFRRPTYSVADWKSVSTQLGEFLGPQLDAAFSEGELANLVAGLNQRMKELPARVPFGTFHNGDLFLGALCYGMVRTLRPRIVVETGVCYGVTSSHLLAALERNGFGHLYSIDLPPLAKNADDYVGWLVPKELRDRWTLRRGASRRLLGPLLEEVGSVGLFVHDSLHTYQNMKMEFELIWPRMSGGGVLIADDIQGNAAFQELTERGDVVFHAAVQEVDKDSVAGVLIKTALSN